MIPHHPEAPAVPPARHSAAVLNRPPAAFARDDAQGGPKRTAAAGRVVIVEDDFLIASQMERELVRAGFDVLGIAGSAEEAVQLAAERPDLYVMDLRLNGQRDGIDAAIEILGKHGIRSIFATAHHDREVEARARPARPLAWLAKPYAMAALVKAVRGAIQELDDERG